MVDVINPFSSISIGRDFISKTDRSERIAEAQHHGFFPCTIRFLCKKSGNI